MYTSLVVKRTEQSIFIFLSLLLLLFGGKGQTAKLIKPKQLQIISVVQSSLKM